MAAPANDLDPRYCANVSILFTELPYDRRFDAARAAGFAGVETWWPFADPEPADAEVDGFLKHLTASGLPLRALNFFAGDMPSGERGVACRPDRQDQLQASTQVLLRIAEATGCRLFNLLYGQLDDRLPIERQHDTALDAIRRAADAVGGIDGTVLLEPLAKGLNGAYPLHTPDDVLAILDRLSDLDNLGLLFDTFHLGSNGVDLVAAAREHVARIRHVQIADAPGRGEPGSGELPITATLAELDEAGYTGWLSCEYRPTTTTAETLGWIPRAQRD